MGVIVQIPLKQCLSHIKSRLNNSVSFGLERFKGGFWRNNIFYISYSSGKEFGRRYYPIYNSALGF